MTHRPTLVEGRTWSSPAVQAMIDIARRRHGAAAGHDGDHGGEHQVRPYRIAAVAYGKGVCYNPLSQLQTSLFLPRPHGHAQAVGTDVGGAMTKGGHVRERRRDYELMYIISSLRPGEEEITTALNRVSQAITNLGGEVTDVNHAAPWGRRKFAYPMREYAEGEASRRMFTEGYYVLTHFKLPTTQIVELERTLKLTDSILRYLLTVIETREQPAVGGTAVSELPVDEDEDEDDED
jgi:small subunit ribosomal protein S6